MNTMNEKECCLDQYLEDNAVIHVQNASAEELAMLMDERNQEVLVNPDLIDYDPVSRYDNW